MKMLHRIIFGMCLFFTVSIVQAQGWEFGIGTGFYALNFDGDGAFETASDGLFEYEVDLDSSDTSDLLESAFGFGGYARNGRWTITYGFGSLELEDDISAVTVSGPGELDVNFTKTAGEVSLNYLFDNSGSHFWGILGGARFTEHEWDADFSVNGVQVAEGKIEEDWTDFIVGLTHAHPISDTLTWTSRFDYGIGDSEGTIFIDTGITWRFADSWSARFYASSTQHDYENDDPGDPDYYLYDTDEFGAGVSILFHF